MVFGGNFLHALDMGLQLRIYELENKIGVARRQQFPFYEKMHWFVALRYVLRWRKHGPGPETELPAFELAGLQSLAAALASWRARGEDGKKTKGYADEVPRQVHQQVGGPEALLADLRAMLAVQASPQKK
jgi:hypothetical protein